MRPVFVVVLALLAFASVAEAKTHMLLEDGTLAPDSVWVSAPFRADGCFSVGIFGGWTVADSVDVTLDSAPSDAGPWAIAESGDALVNIGGTDWDWYLNRLVNTRRLQAGEATTTTGYDPVPSMPWYRITLTIDDALQDADSVYVGYMCNQP